MAVITDKFVRLSLSEVIVDREARQRRDIDTSDLEPSIRRNGVLQPIIIDAGRKLVAGERRLVASQGLVARGVLKAENGQALDSIPVRFAEDLSPAEAQILELEENIKRRDLQWQDLVRSVGRIHKLYQGMDIDWTLAETAEACCLSSGTVSMYLKVNGHLEDERISKASTVREAYNILDRRDQRQAGNELAELIETTNEIVPHAEAAAVPLPSPLHPVPQAQADAPVPAPKWPPEAESILATSFLDWAPAYSGRKFNFIHCDFPYGVNLFSGPQAGGNRNGAYDDSPDAYWTLLDCLCTNFERLMAVSGHLMFWLSADRDIQAETIARFKAKVPSLSFYKFNLVWIKSDNAGIASDPKHGPRHVYETALFGTRASRQIVRVMSDTYSCPTDKRYHVSTKPEPMLRHFMSMIVDENTSMLDPTCGSASSLRAAEDLGAMRVLGMDVDRETVAVARQALRNARTLRGAKL